MTWEGNPMSAVATHLSDPTLAVTAEIARSERELEELVRRGERLHRSQIQHDASSCVVCFLG